MLLNMYQHDTLNTYTIRPVKNKALNSYVALKKKKKNVWLTEWEAKSEKMCWFLKATNALHLEGLNKLHSVKHY